MSILEEAKTLIDGQRQDDYGDMEESFNRIAALWSAYLGLHIDRYDVAKLMILLKVSRAKNSMHRDSYVDIVGYVECVDRMVSKFMTPDELRDELRDDLVLHRI